MANIFTKYGKRWSSDVHPLQVEMWAIQNPEWVKSQGRSLSFHYEQFRRICWPELDGEHNGQRWHKLCRDEILGSKVTVLMGPGSCLRGDSKILNPITGESPTIKELAVAGKRPVVMSLNGPVLAGVPFLKGREPLIEVTLKSGRKFVSTKKHLVLTGQGFRAAESLRIGQFLISYGECLPATTSESGRILSPEDARRFLDTKQDSQVGYRSEHYSCDAQPRRHAASFQCASPLPSYAQISFRSFSPNVIWDRHESEHSRPYQGPSLPSSSGALIQMRQYASSIGFCYLPEIFSHDAYELRQRGRYSKAIGRISPCTQQAFGSFRNLKQHEMPCGEYRVWEDVVQSIKEAGEDDFYDLQVPGDHHYFANGTIHHNSGKTHEAAWIPLVFYWCFPDDTCVLVSSTQVAQLRKRVWGEMTDLWQKGVDRFDFLDGNLLDSALAITTDSLEDVEFGERKTRDMRKGIFGIACVQGGKFVGLNRFVGIKQKNMWLVADEASWMGESFLSAFANLNKNENFYAIVLGNPNDPIDPLGRAAEPKEGWTEDYMEPKKTTVWDTRFMNGRCVNLIGTDSPNFDFPEDKATRFKYLISREKIADTLSFFPKDSLEYYSQCIGSMKIGTMSRRVLNRKMCLENGALEKAIWKHGISTRVYFVDASYGGDLCVGGSGDIGEDMSGKIVLQFNEPKIIPILVGSNAEDAEYQIARFVREDCDLQDVPADCMGHDSTGRGALGTALAKVWSADTHPIESGGAPSDRPVSADLYVTDEVTKERRLKLCSEHYDRKVSEFWYQVRYAVESGQIRGLPEECLSDLCTRKWDRIKRDLISVEPKNRPSTDPNKQGMKQRTGKSPDHGDWAAGIVEMARRKGFIINRLGTADPKKPTTPSWLQELYDETQEIIKGNQLQEA